MPWIGLTLRRLRDERVSAAAFAILVLVTAFLVAAAPRALDRLADDTLRADLGTHPVAPRSIQLIRQSRPSVGATDPFEDVNANGAQLDATIPAEVKAVLGDQAVVVDAPRWNVTKKLNDPTTMALRIQPGAETRIHLVAGRMPASMPDTATTRTIEIAIAAASAKSLKASIGDTIPLAVDHTDSLAGAHAGGTPGVTIVGLFEVNDPRDPWWLGDQGLAGPINRLVGPDAVIVDTMALLSPDELQGLLDVTSGNADGSAVPESLRMTFREYVDTGLIHEAGLGALIPALRKLESLYPDANIRRIGVVGLGGDTAMRTALRSYLVAHLASWGAALRIVSVVAAGPATVAFAALALASVLAARRRRAALSLARGRGASFLQVLRAVVAEGILLAAGPAILGAVAAALLLPGDGPRGALLLGLGVGAAAVLVLVLATVPGIRVAALGGGGREAARAEPPSARRLVFDGLIVLLAVAGTVLLRQRGIVAASSAGVLPTVDPFVAAVPALAGVAAGLLAVRFVPILIAPVARLARGARGLVPLLAMRRATGGGTAAILLVLLATSTIGAFSVAALLHLDQATEDVTWRQMGADYQVTVPGELLRARFDFDSLPGVEASATLFRGRGTIEGRGVFADFAALDLSSYELVVTGTPGAAALPTEIFGPGVEPVPVLVSSKLAATPGGVKVGDTITVRVQGYPFRVTAVGTIDAFPGLAAEDFFILANRDQLREVAPTAPLQATVAFLRAPPAAGPGLQAAVTEAMPSGVVTSRAALAEGLRDSPAVAAIRLAIAVGAAIAALYAALAVAAALALAGSARAIELAHLRTLGLRSGQASQLLLIEHLPAIIVAFAAGLGLGIGLFTALAPSLGLDALVGATIEIGLSLDPRLLALTAGGVVAVVALGLGFGMLFGRSASPVAALRRGFE